MLRRREDGYHDLETVFARIGWADRLTATPDDAFRFTCSDPELPVDDSNLCVRAAQALAAHAGVPLRGHLHLDKRVPYGAGLGGGSSDAAATLRLLADLWNVTVTPKALHTLAQTLGSDVPFFLGPPLALGTGSGTTLTPLDARLPFTVVVAVPDGLHVSTAEAYQLVEPRSVGRPALPALVQGADLAAWRQALANDFEVPILARHPELKALRQALVDLGAGYAALSGTGAALFGVFGDAYAAARASAALPEGIASWHGPLNPVPDA